MIKVYQFHLTDDDRLKINARGWEVEDPKIQAYLKKSITFNDDYRIPFGYYTHVADVLTDDREEAFMYMNLWEMHEDKVITHQEQVFSMSVGDIVEMEDGSRFVCATFGFKDYVDLGFEEL
jgi:hypothetical protein